MDTNEEARLFHYYYWFELRHGKGVGGRIQNGSCKKKNSAVSRAKMIDQILINLHRQP